MGAIFGAQYASYAGYEDRNIARSPVLGDSEDNATFRYLQWSDVLAETQEQYAVSYIVPLSGDAPLPPGVSEWPDEGEFVASPALLEAGEAEGIRTRYGTLVGEIGNEGLTSPTELFA